MDPAAFPAPTGPLTVREALEQGYSRNQLRSRRTWSAPHWGVRVPITTAEGLVERCRSLSTVLDDAVAISHVTALRLLGVELPWTCANDTRLHVVTRQIADRPDRPGVVAHWSRQSFLETIELDGLLLTSPAQTFVHVACGLRRPEDVVVLGDAMMRRKLILTTRAQLTDIAERTHKVKGIVQVREQIEHIRPGTDSSTETRTRLLLTDANLPCPVVNEVVTAPDGSYVKRVDMFYPRHKVAIEYDGDQHRTDRAQWQDDIRRRRLLESLGWIVIVVVADDLREPTLLVARVRSALRQAEQAWL